MMLRDLPQRMKERTLWALWGLMLGGAVLWLLVGSVAYWVKHGLLPADTAGWVQALGALLAVTVAIAVPAWQKWHDMQRAALNDRRRRVECVSAVLSLTQDLLSHFELTAQRLTGDHGGYINRRAQVIQLLARTCRSCVDIDLLAFGNEMVPFVLRIKSTALYAEQAASESHPHLYQYGDVKWELVNRIKGLKKQEAELSEYAIALERY